ncbi:MAG: LysM domain-containing protein [Actinomycetota bacterium]|nr:LysM domain-containing protein [Actinomycetota bacterium]
MTGSDWRTRRRSRRSSVALVSLPVVIALVGGGCGTTDQASDEPLPPIRTTTSTTTIPGTTIPEGVRKFYVIKSGDTLAKIANSFDVTMQSLIDLNNIENPDNVSAGATLEIPVGIIVISNLPTTTV